MNQTLSYFKKIYSSPAIECCDGDCIEHHEQSNFLLLTEFPLWILNENFNFSSMKKHIDIYLYNADMSTDYSNIYNQIHQNFQKIIVNDNYSSIRLNHVNVLGNLRDPQYDSVFITNRDSILPSKYMFLDFNLVEKQFPQSQYL